MAHQVLARKYRPTRFSDVVGQDHVTRTLLNALTQDRIAHGYIFSGHRGIGKTTIARILASSLNCRNAIGSPERPTAEPCNRCDSCLEIRQGNTVDVIEIDAATNRGIDEIRELRDAARYRPARDRFKIYILDEAHQITDAAFNALLKTLEEPPDHVIFMMATTQPEDIPQTIRSRCQHFSFHAVKLDDIVGQLRMIATDEDILADDATLALLAEAGDGSMRDALSIMDQAIASAAVVGGQPQLELDSVRDLMGTVSNVVFEDILDAVSENSSARVLSVAGRLLDAGNGPQQLARQFVRYLRNTVVAKITALSTDATMTMTPEARDLLQISAAEKERVARSAALFSEEELSRFLSIMLRTFGDLGYRQEQRFHLELGLLKLVHAQRLVPVEEILSQLGGATRTTPTGRPSNAGSPSSAAGSRSNAATASTASSQAQSQSQSQQAPAKSASVSPFEADRNRRTPTAASTNGPAASAAAVTASVSGSMALAEAPAASPAPRPSERPHLVPAAPVAAPESAASPESAAALASPVIDIGVLQSAAVEALAATKGQQSASDAAHDSLWSVAEGALQIQTSVSKAMLGVLFGADAQRAMQTALQAHGAGSLRIQLLPGSAQTSPTPAGQSTAASAKKPRAAVSGSASELAQKHPLVQQAQQLFNAEITSIFDLREND
jgi:DNA polymerase-3 subunit gamma/tau